ncbi:Sir2 silent information regulator family NAD-dependent deacetylase [Clostridium sp. MCC353]|uniref:SIR2 family NAD-dependent protein deacylase n=1 Tax=Clostridium sp. MCC353 TaxID=2592646 RepID=UPI001C0130D4|nr:Sir2 silent information regulator family NAD-dependent deacetylase [Clostridium sp. MCC353]MBT9775092.1 Sir2 silent information regulator family NAD-dependent deacetylase [Clostridium sp. MCC353]
MLSEKRKVTFNSFISGIPAEAYIFQKSPYEELIAKAARMIESADYILIGAGAGLSTAAGLSMGGRRFRDNFREFIEKYGGPYMSDMYSAGFYPFPSEEAKWGYWSKSVMINRILPGPLPLYEKVRKLAEKKSHFVLTTNVDHQFYLTGFSEQKIFAAQGDYGLIQCRKGCHPKTYDGISLFRRMDQARKDCAVPSFLVPKCPVCGGPMEMNLRCDQFFVEDEKWHEAERNFSSFLNECMDKKTVLLELGAGFNTPVIIRYPFEKMVRDHENLSLIRLNLDEAFVPEEAGERAVGIGGNMEKSVEDLLGKEIV